MSRIQKRAGAFRSEIATVTGAWWRPQLNPPVPLQGERCKPLPATRPAISTSPSGGASRDETARVGGPSWTRRVSKSGKSPIRQTSAWISQGTLYVSDQHGTRVILRKPDGVWTLLAGEGSALGKVRYVSGLATDTEGNLYIADEKANRLQRRDVAGRWSEVDVDRLEVGGAPSAVTVDASGTLYACAGRLLKRDADGHWSELAEKGGEIGQIPSWWPLRLGTDSAGALYVGDYSPRIQKRDPNGTWTVVCERSTGPGVFLHTKPIAVDSTGSLYVGDIRQRQVQKRDPEGRWTVVLDVEKQLGESHFLSSIALDRKDNLYVVDSVSGSSRVMTRDSHGEWELCMPFGAAAGQAQLPMFVSVDASDNLYVIDRQANRDGVWGGGRLQRRDRKGHWTILAEIGPESDRQLGLAQLDVVAAAPNGNVYVSGAADSFNGGQARLRMRDSKGRWTTVAEFGHELGQVAGGVQGIATDSSGRLYVAESSPGNRVQVRDANGRWYELGHRELLSGWIAGLAVDRQDVVYVIVNDPPKVLRWTPQPDNKAVASGSQKKR